MSWEKVQLKYSLIRIAEILQSWAKFTKSSYMTKINQHKDNLLTNDLAYAQLEIIKKDFQDIIEESNDINLISDTQWFINESHGNDQSKDRASTAP